MEDNDPDTLQLIDESDSEWVNLWQKAANKKTKETQLTVDCIPTENTIQHQSRRISKKKPITVQLFNFNNANIV